MFRRLVREPQQTKLRLGSVLHELHDVGLLLAMVPEFEPVVGRVHHDIYHVYTVDVHSIRAVDRLRALTRGELAEEFPLASRLAAEIARPTVLFFATFLHDVGKALGGKNHSENGAIMAQEIVARLGLSEADVTEVVHLISEHLRMYHVATRRDIDDPRTIEDMCEAVHGREGLRELYLLTVSDVSTTSPTAMTSWKSRMLEELYIATQRVLEVGAEKRDGKRVRRVIESVQALWGDAPDREYLDHFLIALPERYLYANSPGSIVKQAQFVADSRGEPVKLMVLGSREPYVEIAVLTEDRFGALAHIAASFSASRLRVIGAQIYSWNEMDGHGRVLDIFWVSCGLEVDSTLRAVPSVEENLGRLLRGELTPEQLLGMGGRASSAPRREGPEIRSKLNIDNRCASRHTVIEVITRNSSNLLFRLADTLNNAGVRIDLAKINTEGDRVADVFYVTDTDGAKLVDPAALSEIKLAVYETLKLIDQGDSGAG